MVENYKGVFDNRIGFGKRPAMLLIDFVEAYFDKSCPLYANVEDNLASALRILEHARHADIPIIYTNVVYHENMADAGVFYNCLLYTSPSPRDQRGSRMPSSA